jgi:hypothetical protein
MENITDLLISFSNKYDLLNLTKKCALKSIDNCLCEDRELKHDPFPGLTSENFIFEIKKQELIFLQFGNPVFILRTTFLLYTDKQTDKSIPVGEYSLDIDMKGEITDDSLHFF